ncbi:hypothetical protein GCM10029992_57740 [Glycomyces albus]
MADLGNCREAVGDGAAEVYNLACNMGGMGFIENNKALCMLSVLPSTHMLMASKDAEVGRFFYSSSACVYAGYKQTEADIAPLKEEDAYPADAEDGYGWEKLFSERMCRHFREDFGLQTRVARYHNIYGPEGTWDGGREKAPPPPAARSPSPPSPARPRSRSGATASRRARSPTSTTASAAPRCSPVATSPSRSTSAPPS